MTEDKRQLFDIPEDITYLNIASLSPSFKSIEKAGIDAVIEKSRPYKIPTSDFFEPVITLKKLFAELIDAKDYNRIATIPSVSYGLANVANNVSLNPDDEVIIIEEQFPSNVYIWKKLVKQYGAKLKVIKAPDSETDFGSKWNESILEAITNKTALVALGNIHWANGTIFDLAAIRKKTRAHNALLIIDGSQSIGALPFSVKEIDPDALVCAGYKWLFGPYGCAYAYYGPYFDDGTPIEENWANRLNSENLSGLTNYQPEYKPLANRYTVGENGSFIYVRMQIAALKEVLKFHPQELQDYCQSITEKAIDDLKSLGFHVRDAHERAKHLFGIELPKDIDVQQLKSQLAESNIYVSFRGHYIRLSCHFYNTPQDFEKLVDCISSILKPING